MLPKNASLIQQGQQNSPVTSPACTTGDTVFKRHTSSSSSRIHQTPRNMQSQRKQNKTHHRPRLDDEDAVAEQAAIRATASRKGQTSITHLMQFSLPPRPQSNTSSSRAGRRRNPIWGIGSGYHSTDKARYVHANYRFVVNPRGDYRKQLLDPDVHVDWDQVLQVLAAITEDTSCPICLSIPVAPRLAECGHIFCLACIIRYMHATDDIGPVPEKRRRWKPCPICFDSVFMHELKPVRWIHERSACFPREGSDVVLRLVMKNPGSNLALPRDVAESRCWDDNMPWYFDAEVFEFAHYMRGSGNYMQEQYSYEIDALQLQEREDELMFGEETTWSKKAIATIRDLREKARSIDNPPELIESNIEHTPIRNRLCEDTPYYFYQAPLHSYLSPLDIKILKAAFGDFELFPSTLLPRVEHVSTGHVVDDDIRKRAKYLAHLPLGYEINFLECDWTDIVPRNILDQFKTDLEHRKRRNEEKALREEKARLRAELTEDKKWYGARQRPSLSKGKEVEQNEHLTDDLGGFPSSPDLNFISSSPPWLTFDRRHISSFASLASPSTSPGRPRTVWGMPIVAGDTPRPPSAQREPDRVTENDGWLQNWETDLLEEEDLIAQIKDVSPGSATGATSATSTANSKKKKKTRIILMSTNGRRAA